MRKAIAASVVLLIVVAGCSTSSSTPAMNAKLKMPEILIAQTSDVPVAARHTDGMLSVHFAVRVENRDPEPITLKLVTLQTISRGAYDIQPSSKPFEVMIPTEQREEVEMWVPALAGSTILGANGPVMLRVTCEFDSAKGKFQHSVVTLVNERTSITGVR